MKLRILILLVLGMALVLVPTAAEAKGPRAVEIIGPGLDAPIRVERTGNTGTPGGQLVQAAGFWQTFEPFAYGSVATSMTASPPSGRRGARYVITYLLSPDGEERVRHELYPFAEGGPLVRTPAGQSVYGEVSPHGGWRRVDPRVTDLLLALGVPTPAERKGWRTSRDDEHGLSISYPPSWQPAKDTVAPLLIDPVIPLALGTYEFPTQGCGAVPGRALREMGPNDAFIAVYVFGGGATWGPPTAERPSRFGPDLPWSDGPFKCTGDVQGTVRAINFPDDNLRLSVMVGIGPDASGRRRHQVYRILDTLTVESAERVPAPTP